MTRWLVNVKMVVDVKMASSAVFPWINEDEIMFFSEEETPFCNLTTHNLE